VGHSLENDLRALKLVHERCVDTALLFPHPRGLPYKNSLKHLAKRFLKLDIQKNKTVMGEDGKEIVSRGHDSVEDAKAAMKLAQLKILKGPSFGVDSSDSENILKILGNLKRKVSSLFRFVVFLSFFVLNPSPFLSFLSCSF
jgi:RNA exonuclease 1